jgi:hypothetical protein
MTMNPSSQDDNSYISYEYKTCIRKGKKKIIYKKQKKYEAKSQKKNLNIAKRPKLINNCEAMNNIDKSEEEVEEYYTIEIPELEWNRYDYWGYRR